MLIDKTYKAIRQKTTRITLQKALLFSMPLFFISTLIFFLAFLSQKVYANSIGNKLIVGISEKLIILPGEISFKAKIDTGAENSSMHATDIEMFTLSDKKFVRFTTENLDGKSVTLELPLVRIARIKRHQQESQKRPIVNIGICMGSVYKIVEVSLTDRSRFEKRFLVGTSFLIDSFIVDVTKIYTKVSSCNSIAG